MGEPLKQRVERLKSLIDSAPTPPDWWEPKVGMETEDPFLELVEQGLSALPELIEFYEKHRSQAANEDPFLRP